MDTYSALVLNARHTAVQRRRRALEHSLHDTIANRRPAREAAREDGQGHTGTLPRSRISHASSAPLLMPRYQNPGGADGEGNGEVNSNSDHGNNLPKVSGFNDVAIVMHRARICKSVHNLRTCGSFGSGSVLVSPFCFSIDTRNPKGVAINGRRGPTPPPL